MKTLIEQIRAFDQPVTFENLAEFIDRIDIEKLNYRDLLLTEVEPGDYGRNILCLDPFECVLIYWPPQSASAIHFHEGFFGHVMVLEGSLDNVEYERDSEFLSETRVLRYGQGGVAPEPDGVIHKLVNPSAIQPAVSLHFYYPALETLEDLVIYDPEKCGEGTLSAEALSANWSDKPGHFKHQEVNAFVFRDLNEMHHHASHLMHPVIPKPGSREIGEMVESYYSEQAQLYDKLDKSVPKRMAYTDRIDSLIAQALSQRDHLEEVLHVAIGTGRRAENILDLCEKDYEIFGVDISEHMCEEARNRGLKVIHSGWVDSEIEEGKQFCAAAWLYGFGHMSRKTVRIEALRKINRHLKEGASFFFDVFNVDNKNEWGPLAIKAFHNLQLSDAGYEEGDVFYRRSNANQVAFLHYFKEQEVLDLLEETGFRLVDMQTIGYAKDSGILKTNKDEGFFFIHAVKEREV